MTKGWPARGPVGGFASPAGFRSLEASAEIVARPSPGEKPRRSPTANVIQSARIWGGIDGDGGAIMVVSNRLP